MNIFVKYDFNSCGESFKQNICINIHAFENTQFYF